MATIGKIPLSGEVTSGESTVLVAATATAGTTIHTAGTGTSNLDEVWLWANNNSAGAIILDIEWGNDTANRNLQYSIGANETVLIVPGWLLSNDKVIKAFAASANVINIIGFVNRITA